MLGDVSLDTPDWGGNPRDEQAGVGGPLVGDVTVPVGARLLVLSSIHVPEGVTMEIGKGAELNFTLQTGILVQGTSPQLNVNAYVLL